MNTWNSSYLYFPGLFSLTVPYCYKFLPSITIQITKICLPSFCPQYDILYGRDNVLLLGKQARLSLLEYLSIPRVTCTSSGKGTAFVTGRNRRNTSFERRKLKGTIFGQTSVTMKKLQIRKPTSHGFRTVLSSPRRKR